MRVMTCCCYLTHLLANLKGTVPLEDESGEEREDLFLDTGTRSSNNRPREARIEREEKLKKMMEGMSLGQQSAHENPS